MEISSASIIAVFVIAGNFLISRGMDVRDKKSVDAELERLNSLISKLFSWKDEHLKDSSDMRLGLSNQIAQIVATIQVNQSQYVEIIRRLSVIEEHFQNKRRNTD